MCTSFCTLVDRRDGLAQRGIGRQIERYGDGWKLTLVGNGQRLRRLLEVRESAQRTALLMPNWWCRQSLPPCSTRRGVWRKRVQRRSKDICRWRVGAEVVSAWTRRNLIRTTRKRKRPRRRLRRQTHWTGCRDGSAGWVQLKLRFTLQHQTMILIHLRIHGVDLPLAEGVIQGVIDGRNPQCQVARL